MTDCLPGDFESHGGVTRFIMGALGHTVSDLPLDTKLRRVPWLAAVHPCCHVLPGGVGADHHPAGRGPLEALRSELSCTLSHVSVPLADSDLHRFTVINHKRA